MNKAKRNRSKGHIGGRYILTLLLTLVMASIIILAVSVPVAADVGDYVTIDGLIYKIQEEPTVSGNGKAWLFDWESGNLPTTDLTIPSVITHLSNNYDVTALDTDALYYCDEITSITIPASVVEIKEDALSLCNNLTTIIVADGNLNYASGNGVLYNKAKTVLLQYPAGNPATSFTVPNGVTMIENLAFRDAASLRQVTLPASVTDVHNRTFRFCSSLENIFVDAGNSVYYNSISGMLFLKADNTLLKCPEGKTGTITIPSTCKKISSTAFNDCSGITDFAVEGGSSPYFSVENDLLYGIAEKSLVRCLESKTGSISIKAGTEIIADFAFYACNNLTEIVLPNTVKMIGTDAFYLCTNLTTLSLPPSLISIGEYAFGYCESFTGTFYIPASVTVIGEQVFAYLNTIEAIEVADGNTAYSSDGSGVLYNKNKSALIYCPKSITGTYTIPNSVTRIHFDAFQNCKYLTGITMSSNIQSIGEYAFSSCESLSGSVTLPASLNELGSQAFYKCYFDSVTFEGAKPAILGKGALYLFSDNAELFVPDDPSWDIDWSDIIFETMAVHKGGKIIVGDSTPPTVDQVYPEGIDIDINGNIDIFFSEEVVQTSGVIRLYDSTGIDASHKLGTVSWSEDNTYCYIEYRSLDFDMVHTLHIEGFKDLAGNVMLTDAGHSFMTMQEPDVPTVSPSDLTVLIGKTNIFAVFLGQGGTLAGSAEIVSDHPEIASVDISATGTTGQIITIRGESEGNTFITITFSGGALADPEYATISVTVLDLYYSLHYDANGGVGDMPSESIGMHSSTVVKENAFTRSGYRFVGWASSPTDTTVFKSPGASLQLTAEVTLYAIWEAEPTSGNPGLGTGGSGGGGGTTGPAAPAAPAVPSSLDITADTFDKAAGRKDHKEITVTLTPGSGTLMKIMNGSVTLKEGVDYQKDGNTYTFTIEYLETLKNGKHALVFDMSTGADPILEIVVRGSVTKNPEPVDSDSDSFMLPFTDIPQDAWYRQDVVTAYRNGLINGKSATLYAPEDNITFVEAIKLAACMHQLYHDKAVTLEVGTVNWYSTYIDYALENGIIEEDLSDYADEIVTRVEFVNIFYGAIPESEYNVINDVADGAIPDVEHAAQYAERIYAFYRAGILVGSDAAGTFNPTSNIQRSEVAAIMTRMFTASARRSIELK